MGGYGSGHWYRWNTKDAVEGTLRLDVRQLARAADLTTPGTFLPWGWRYSDGRESSIGIAVGEHALILTYTWQRGQGEAESIRQGVPLTWMPCNYGGRRPWLRCPGVKNGRYCGRRVAILYLAGRYFLCRRCYGLAYTSQRESKPDRMLRKAEKIRRRLGGQAGVQNRFPGKPKGMHWRTYSRLCTEADQAELTGTLALLGGLEAMHVALGKRLDLPPLEGDG
jgi:hypothetical protein